MIQIPLGQDRGWIELHIDGRAVLFSVDYPDEPIFHFNAEDAEMLGALASELGTMSEAWEELKKQSPEHINPAGTTGNKYDHQGGEEEEPGEATHSPGKRSPSPLPDQPKLVGMGAPKVATAGSP
ncbi:MAG: hypothetical protein LAO76_26395 [Acidobacteriia bacterium]|nr:hypothetical protein [Terriglobia bacterium]